MGDSTDKEVRLKVRREEAATRIEAQVHKGEEILSLSIRTERALELAANEEQVWSDFTSELLSKLFTTRQMVNEFLDAGSGIVISEFLARRIENFHRRIERRVVALRSILERLDLFEEDTELGATPSLKEVESVSKKDVYVVHGRNKKLTDSIFDFLRAIGLKPREWPQAMSATGEASPYIGQILDSNFAQVQAVVVLLSGDDEARLRQEFAQPNDPRHEKELTPQPRPNVLFEAGMAMGRRPDKTVLVQVGELRLMSDIAGRHVTRLDNSAEKRHELAMKLKTAGCEIDLTGKDWMTAGDFEVRTVEPRIGRDRPDWSEP